jgi:protein-S-isoprenylcysteine O-methyltransferase Ste14
VIEAIMDRLQNSDRFGEKPNTIPWPPLLLVGALTAATLLQLAIPFGFALPGYARLLGAAIVLAGLAFDVSAIVTMRHARANILPHRPATRLVTVGPFRYTRNPIYLGNVLLCAGLSLALSNPWLCATGTLMAFAVDHLAIRREEIHLANQFGSDWERYKAATPRWLLI